MLLALGSRVGALSFNSAALTVPGITQGGPNVALGEVEALAPVARLLRDADVARKLRDSRDAEALYAVLAMPSASAA